MRVEVQYVDQKWEITVLESPLPLAGRKIATAEELILEDVRLHGQRIIGTPVAAWGLEVLEGVTLSPKELGVGGRFGKPPGGLLKYVYSLGVHVDSVTSEVVTQTPQLRLKGRSMRYWR